MDSPDDNFSFDFFDEDPGPAEAAQGLRGRLPRRPGRRPGTPGPPRPVAPLLRLAALVFFVIFLLLVFVLLITSCAGQSRHAAYSGYMRDVNTIAAQSSADGAGTVSVLTTAGLSVNQMVSKLESLAADEQQNVQAAEGLSPPGRLRPENAALIQALQLRVLGIDGLAAAFQHAAAAKSSASEEALALSGQANRLLASDVVWDDLFQKPALSELSKEGVSGVNVPESSFLADPNLIVTPRAMALVVTRIVAGATTKGSCAGLHGTNLVSVEALNGSGGKPQILTAGKLNTVTTSSSLVFRVTIHDGGNFQEVQIKVQLTIGGPQEQGGPINRTGTVQLIDPGDDQSVLFGDLGQVPFDSQTTLTVNVASVCGETNLANNTASYNVIFSLPGA
jgi:hypothetical protein